MVLVVKVYEVHPPHTEPVWCFDKLFAVANLSCLEPDLPTAADEIVSPHTAGA